MPESLDKPEIFRSVSAFIIVFLFAGFLIFGIVCLFWTVKLWNREFFETLACSIVVGMFLLLATMPLIGKIKTSLVDAFWMSFIGHVMGLIIMSAIGVAFAYHMTMGLVLGLLMTLYIQATVYLVAMKSKSKTLVFGRALIISMLAILSDFFIASPIYEFISTKL